jgi:hypothetical protein
VQFLARQPNPCLLILQQFEIFGDELARMDFGGHETLGIQPILQFQAAATMVAKLGDDGFFDFEIAGISPSARLGILAGNQLRLSGNLPVTRLIQVVFHH